MLLAEFPTASDLQKFCVAQAIVQSKIVQIWCKDSRWFLFYYA